MPMSDQQDSPGKTQRPLHEVARALPRIILATALMGLAAYGAMELATRWVGSAVAQSGIRLLAGLLAGLVVYYVSAKLLGCKELDELLGRDS